MEFRVNIVYNYTILENDNKAYLWSIKRFDNACVVTVLYLTQVDIYGTE